MTFKLAVLNIVLDFLEIEVVVHERSNFQLKIVRLQSELVCQPLRVLFEKKQKSFIAVDLYTMQ